MSRHNNDDNEAMKLTTVCWQMRIVTSKGMMEETSFDDDTYKR
jgi:hypothetical protein